MADAEASQLAMWSDLSLVRLQKNMFSDCNNVSCNFDYKCIAKNKYGSVEYELFPNRGLSHDLNQSLLVYCVIFIVLIIFG